MAWTPRVIQDGVYTGLGVNPRGRAYPFLRVQPELPDVLVDLCFAPVSGTQLPLLTRPPYRLTYVEGLDAAYDANFDPDNPTEPKLVILNGASETLFDNTQPSSAYIYTGYPFGETFYVHHWQAVNENGGPAMASLWMIQRRAFRTDEDVWPIPAAVSLSDGELDPRTIHYAALGITGFYVETDQGLYSIGNQVRLGLGYNTRWKIGRTSPISFLAGVSLPFGAQLPETLQPYAVESTNLTLEAVAGYGLGRYQPQPEDLPSSPVVKRINLRQPNEWGDLTLAGDDCIVVQPPLVKATDGGQVVYLIAPDSTLQMEAWCYPCCDCEMYVRVYRALGRLQGHVREVGQEAEEVTKIHNRNVALLREYDQCQQDGGLRGDAHRFLNFWDWGVLYCNMTGSCIPLLTLAIQLPPGLRLAFGRVMVIEPNGRWQDVVPSRQAPTGVPDEGPGTYYVQYAKLHPDQSVQVRGRAVQGREGGGGGSLMVKAYAGDQLLATLEVPLQ